MLLCYFSYANVERICFALARPCFMLIAVIFFSDVARKMSGTITFCGCVPLRLAWPWDHHLLLVKHYMQYITEPQGWLIHPASASSKARKCTSLIHSGAKFPNEGLYVPHNSNNSHQNQTLMESFFFLAIFNSTIIA